MGSWRRVWSCLPVVGPPVAGRWALMGRTAVVVAAVVAVVALVLVLQVLGRVASGLSLEPRARPLRMGGWERRTAVPAELVQLEALVRAALTGDRGAAERLARRLEAVGQPVERPLTTAGLQAALAALHHAH